MGDVIELLHVIQEKKTIHFTHAYIIPFELFDFKIRERERERDLDRKKGGHRCVYSYSFVMKDCQYVLRKYQRRLG